MNILVTLDKGYINPLCVMLCSLADSHPDVTLDVYVMNKSFDCADYGYIKSKLNCEQIRFHDVKVDDKMLADAPVTDRYPREMYYRIFAAKFLPPGTDKILYLDPDLVVIKNLSALYSLDLGNNYFAAASHVGKSLQKINEIRLQMDTKGPYINSGVMLMNLELLRKEQNYSEVFEYIEKNRNILFLPDQDIISAIYSDKILPLDPYIYNMTERMLRSPRSAKREIDYRWVEKNSAIIHYCGKNKPWKASYAGTLGSFYKKYSDKINC